MVSNDIKRLTTLILAIEALALMAVFGIGIGEPTGPDTLTFVQTSRFTTLAPNQTEAQAGNLTELSIVAQASTKAWQGFYGNISGTITLEDSSGNVFYDWSAAEPEGEIYASTNQSVTWTNIRCFNFTNASQNGGSTNLSIEETRFGMDDADVDGIDETYSVSTHDQFFVGTVEVVANSCRSTYAYVSSTAQADNWQNVLLIDPDGGSLVFTSIIENRDAANDTDKIGYNGLTYDFQLLVAEDEHTAPAAGSTTYYFWVEIE